MDNTLTYIIIISAQSFNMIYKLNSSIILFWDAMASSKFSKPQIFLAGWKSNRLIGVKYGLCVSLVWFQSNGGILLLCVGPATAMNSSLPVRALEMNECSYYYQQYLEVNICAWNILHLYETPNFEFYS